MDVFRDRPAETPAARAGWQGPFGRKARPFAEPGRETRVRPAGRSGEIEDGEHHHGAGSIAAAPCPINTASEPKGALAKRASALPRCTPPGFGLED